MRSAFTRLFATAGLVAGVAAANLTAADVVLNELMAANVAAVPFPNTTEYPDWIELYNRSSQDANLSGMSVTDDPLVPGRYTFPANTTISGNGYLRVWCDYATNLSGLHTGFTLKAGGGMVALYSAGASPVLLDSVTFGPQLDDLSIGRVPDGTGTWQLTQPTSISPNTAQALGSASSLKINEWMAKPSSGSDWFELYNPEALPVALGGLTLTDVLTTPALTTIQSLSFIGSGGFLEFAADEKPADGPTHVNFKLGSTAGSIGLFSPARVAIDTVTYGTQSEGVSQGRLPDGAAKIVSFLTGATPGESNYLPIYSVIINEVLTHSDPPLEDAVELYNSTVNPVDISGWYLSNNKLVPKKYLIPANTVLAPYGFHVFYEHDFNANTNLPTSFTFNSAHGDEINLAGAVNGVLTGYRTSVKFGAAANGVSFGRYTTAAVSDFVALSRRTFGVDNPATVEAFRQGGGASNAAPMVGPIVISQIMYHPPDIIEGTNHIDSTTEEFVELLNITDQTVPLFDPAHTTNTWRLANAVEFVFPAGVSLLPGARLLVVSFDPQTDKTGVEGFRARYGELLDVPLYGPYRTKLSNAGDNLQLMKPDPPQEVPHPDAGYVPRVLVEKVKYSDFFPWPTSPDGGGTSLHRRIPDGYGDDPYNWFAYSPTPGRAATIRINAARLASGSALLSFDAAAAVSYSIQFRSSLFSGAWLKFQSITAATTNRTVEVTDTAPALESARFYRLVTPAVP